MRAMAIHSGLDVNQFHPLPAYPGPPPFVPYPAPEEATNDEDDCDES